MPSDMSSLKNKVDKLGIGKLETTPVDLSKVSNLRKNEIIKKILMILKKFMIMKRKMQNMIIINTLLIRNLIR